MPWRVTDEADTLPYSQQVQAWMDGFWKDNPCAVCNDNDWRAEGRMFFLQRMMPGEDEQGRQGMGAVPGVGRMVFPVVCLGCGNTILIHSQIAGVQGSPIPGDLSDLGQ